MIIKALEKQDLRIESVSRLSNLIILIAVIAYANDTNLVGEGENAESAMNEMLKIHSALCEATVGQTEEGKSIFYRNRNKGKEIKG